MYLSYQWLKQYVDLPQDLTMDQLAYDLTMRTVEVEGVENLADRYEKIVVGKILKIEAHPNADRLRIVQLDVGQDQPVQVVCGGSNLFEGHYVLVNLPGSKAIWHGQGEPVVIQPGQLRGVPSEGMISGAEEVGLSDLFPARGEREIVDFTAQGLEKEAEIYPGQPVAELLGLDDIIIEIENKSITNRPDLWGHYGIARELAAIYGKELKELPGYQEPDLPEYPAAIESPELCHRLLACQFDGVDHRPSPLWMRTALMKCGMRPINALVDITNYAMLATGNPCHAYDSDHVQGGLIARRAHKDEKLTILDGHVLDLSEEDIVIADQEKALGLAGLMGGKDDSILETTHSIIFEIGNFDGAHIRKTSQRYNVRTEASMRFEKQIDTQRADQCFALTQALLQEIFPESRALAFKNVCPESTKQATVDLSLAWLERRLGREIDRKQVQELLAPLGFSLDGEGDQLLVHAPSWRSTGDISLPDDVLEEVARMIGYENFDLLPPQLTLTGAINQREKSVDRQFRQYLASSCGFYEIYSYPWIKDLYVQAAGEDEKQALRLAMPPAPDQAKLRTSLIPGQIEAIAKNLRFYNQFRIFESSEVYAKGVSHPSCQEESLPLQTRQIAGSVVDPDAAKAFYTVKGVLEHLQEAIQVKPISFSQKKQPSWADAKAWLNIENEGRLIGSMGLLSNRAKHMADIKYAEACLFVLNWEELTVLESRTNAFQELPQYPHVLEDLSLLVSDDYSWEDVQKEVAPLVEKVEFVDEYRGSQIPEGYRSLTLRLELGSDEGTLTGAQVSQKRQHILGILEKKLGINLRKS